MSLAYEQRTQGFVTSRCCSNGEKDHQASGLGMARAEEAEVCRGIIKRPDWLIPARDLVSRFL